MGIIKYIYKHILICYYPDINSFLQDFLDSGRIKIIFKCHTLEFNFKGKIGYFHSIIKS